ncbi:hypothetical protein [Mucilaginibacter sp. L3T2-6]|uniref:hypothetical protein n=1 Tax=Mucilaginibacter sp. L3T2-6 TaxID=3062491 RepID=UPI002676EDF7|nr:hypothetical protein [Mucilaginibacter sp. L3T2-6]MDO3642968.1 hypothetical protein [Mucilaginibacter sp. L3T2-6]MDV6215293.1 hypothetical protein [Mucilaginibacter sp. L3T2-6]
MALKTGIMGLAHNKKGGKNGQKSFSPSTKTALERSGTIMPVRYKNSFYNSGGGKMA